MKGQKGKGQKYFTPALLRRENCINTLKQCPINQWLHINEFIRLMIANKDFLPITQEPSFLYIGDQHYGEIYDGEFLVTAYMRCLLMEYFFTLGLIDIAYCHPTESTDNYFSSENYWDLDCLSRYDGLAYLRLTPLGAYVLKIKDSYIQTKKVSQTNLEFVGRHNIQFKQPPSVNEKIFLTNYAEEKKQNLWVLSSDKILSYLENGGDLNELQSFLKNRDTQPYFSNSIESFFKTMESNKSAVNNKGDFKLVTCQSKEVATNIASAPKLKNWCQQVSDTQLIYPKDKHNQFRILIHQLNYGMPI
ncbi:hypothetical protein [Marinicellulosiphila megalodicopiae]|uniref:hypothetical protein n=1 Tax=Marinicellulosiphila megalodicopiae TaxID=2724896 RepID=UPI003BB1D6DE